MSEKKGFVKITIEQDDGITASSQSLTYYDEDDSQAEIVNVLESIMEDYFEAELGCFLSKYSKDKK